MVRRDEQNGLPAGEAMTIPRNLPECETPTPRTDKIWDARRPDSPAITAAELHTLARQLERELRQARWIPVSERLPDETKPHEGYVLVSADGAMDCMAFYKGEWQNWTNPNSPNVHPEYITHWMPLPSPPEKK